MQSPPEMHTHLPVLLESNYAFSLQIIILAKRLKNLHIRGKKMVKQTNYLQIIFVYTNVIYIQHQYASNQPALPVLNKTPKTSH